MSDTEGMTMYGTQLKTNFLPIYNKKNALVGTSHHVFGINDHGYLYLLAQY